jgi:hypothetical protein
MSTADLSKEIEEEIEEEIRNYTSLGRRNHTYDLGCTVGAIGTSLIGGVLSASGAEGFLMGLLVGIPGALVTLHQRIDYNGRKTWNFEYATRIRAVRDSLKYGALSPPEAATELSKIRIKMEKMRREYVKSRPPEEEE